MEASFLNQCNGNSIETLYFASLNSNWLSYKARELTFNSIGEYTYLKNGKKSILLEDIFIWPTVI
tara:strand:- start:434 stop:628 length:195 start_codon:yes stop_codon:yes gene_type:complete